MANRLEADCSAKIEAPATVAAVARTGGFHSEVAETDSSLISESAQAIPSILVRHMGAEWLSDWMAGKVAA